MARRLPTDGPGSLHHRLSLGCRWALVPLGHTRRGDALVHHSGGRGGHVHLLLQLLA